jgi:hypothetical protein
VIGNHILNLYFSAMRENFSYQSNPPQTNGQEPKSFNPQIAPKSKSCEKKHVIQKKKYNPTTSK